MRTNVVLGLTALGALLALPSESSAQRRPPLPRTGRTPGAQPAPLPPEMPAVSRALAYRRSRWSVEGYPFVSQIQVPTSNGDATYTTLGSGSRGDYRLSDHFSLTLDITSSLPLTTTMTGSAELGTRFRPMPWGERVRPFADLRVGYAYLSDVYATPSDAFSFIPGSSPVAFTEAGRRSRGFGGLAGAGVEYSLTPSIAVTTGVTAMRSRMTSYRLSGFTPQANQSRYWMTSTRYTIGLKFNPVTLLHLDQNPRQ